MMLDERVSPTYEPKHFRPLIPTDPSNPPAHYNEIPLECACGGIDTQHHQMTLEVKTASTLDDIHDDQNDQQGHHEEANDHADDDAAMAPVDAHDDGQQLSVLGEIRAFCERHNECVKKNLLKAFLCVDEYLGELVCADFLVKRGNSRYYLSNPRRSTDNPNEAPQTTAQQPHTARSTRTDRKRPRLTLPMPNYRKLVRMGRWVRQAKRRRIMQQQQQLEEE
ncbi:unnamed protein product [Vitrella brassicaformis CCMP3155]|uniref:Uncharacterized protein n=1 Tax=Vitrella brassicaformis (strain CCMP3155) TaxID=1169540 RepID=A0A0G4FE67_VITBC|nr:unnamed protein product [Vitrella brassicaformis CCMP3155]|eukprot:CEM11270.1 unnamed protein product [Vitrella brassicaformis CCMP3155]